MFNNKPGDQPGPATGTRQAPFSLLGSDVVFVGNITAETDLHVDGRIEGDVACAGLVQGSESVIKGNITVRTARISGRVEGVVTADELMVERGAFILGDCSYGSITLAAGASVDGRLKPKTSAAPELKVVASAAD